MSILFYPKRDASGPKRPSACMTKVRATRAFGWNVRTSCCLKQIRRKPHETLYHRRRKHWRGQIHPGQPAVPEAGLAAVLRAGSPQPLPGRFLPGHGRLGLSLAGLLPGQPPANPPPDHPLPGLGHPGPQHLRGRRDLRLQPLPARARSTRAITRPTAPCTRG